jgi:Tfp pilus assembly protein PilV
MKVIHLNKKGDTIVEVLIAMVILAFVLTGAYESSQYSLNTIRNSENRITAINIASSQIESLKSWVSSNPTVPNFSGDFYMNGTIPTPVSSPQIQGNFMYEFTPPVQQSNTNYTFTINVYWQNLNTNSLSNACSSQNLSNCDNVEISYRSAV